MCNRTSQMNASSCPSRARLQAYVVGKLDDDTSEAISNHVDVCPDCQALIATVDDQDDTLLANLRRAPAGQDYAERPAFKEAVRKAKALVSSGDSGGFGLSADPGEEASRLGQLGEYELLGKLGQGGMGTVYKARQIKLNRIVALKVLSKGRMDDQSAIARFEREMEAVGSVDHPNIVRAMDAREIDGTPVLVTEYVDGLDLAQLVHRRGPLPIADACEIGRRAATGLQAVHEHGLVHRDIKPSNLMLTTAGELKILDLGLARLQKDAAEGEELTGSGQIMGTSDYIAPEQALESHTVDIRADIYSLGCTLYRLLTGRPPFGGKEHDTPLKKAMAHVHQPVPPIRELRSEVPDGLAAVIDRMLAKDPDQRYSTPAEVAAALAPFVAGCDVAGLLAAVTAPDSLAQSESLSVSTVESASASQQDTPPPVRAGSPPEKEARDPRAAARPRWSFVPRRPVRAVAVAAGVAGILALAAIIIIRTPRGTIRIELSHKAPDIEVKVDGKRIEITGPKDPLTLKIGEHELEVTSGEFERVKKPFTVRKGVNPALQVQLQRRWKDDTQWRWQERAAMPKAKRLAAAVRVGESIYVIGGEDSRSYSESGDVQRYDISKNTWEARSPCPERLSRHCLVAYEGKIWVIGGNHGRLVQVYDPATDRWSTGPSLQQQRGDFAALMVGKNIYCLGGGQKETRCEIYDPSQDLFDWGPELRHGGAASAVMLGNQCVVIHSVGDVDVWNLDTGEVSTLPSLPSGYNHGWYLDRHYTALLSRGTLLAIEWGGLEAPQDARMFRYVPDQKDWVAMPFHGQGLGRRALPATVSDERGGLYIFGGVEDHFPNLQGSTISRDVQFGEPFVVKGPKATTGSSASTCVVTVRAHIDHGSVLVLRRGEVQWRNASAGAVPGRNDGDDYPTYINGKPWKPTWPSKDAVPRNAMESDRYACPELRVPPGKPSAKLVRWQGGGGDSRSPVWIECRPGEVLLNFEDRSFGASWYVATVEIGNE